MNKKQQAVLDKANKTTLKNEQILSGGSKYINPIRREAAKSKKQQLESIQKKQSS